MKHAPLYSVAKPIGNVPNYLKPNVKELLNKIGDFIYD